ncbi:MAG: hypothetical protein KDK90_11420 [Leptospiraceae bacterium]|nr:hypothetical protein [Leptospiraceae bacterium]
MLNPRISVIVSLLSGAGFVVILAITPLKKSQSKKVIQPVHKLEEPTLKNEKDRNHSFLEKPKEEKRELFSIVPFKITRQDLPYEDSFSGQMGIYKTFQEPIVLWEGETVTYYSKNNLHVSAVTDKTYKDRGFRDTKNPNGLENYSYAYLQPRKLKRFEVNYQLGSSFSAVVKTSSFDMYDERFQNQTSFPMFGFNYSKGEKITTKITAGDNYSISQNKIEADNFNYGIYQNSLNLQNGASLYYRVFEWQTNIQATKSLAFQTSIYNSWRDKNNITTNATTPEGARFAVSYGLKFLVLNLKYNYNSNYMFRGFKPPSEDSTASDYGGVGFTLFIDPERKYALYIGNNYYNLVTNNIYNLNLNNSSVPPTTSSFVASLRGKNSKFFNTTFFVNFKNYYYKNYLYTNIGNFRLNTSTKEYSEYSTSMGLELSF